MQKKTTDSIIQQGMNILDWFFLDKNMINELKRRFQSRMITAFLRKTDQVLFRKTRRASPERKLHVFYQELDDHGRPMKWTRAMLSESALRITGIRFPKRTPKRKMVSYLKALLLGAGIAGGLYYAKKKADEKKSNK